MRFLSMGKGRGMLSAALVAGVALSAVAVANPAAAAEKKAETNGKTPYSKDYVAAAGPLQTKVAAIQAAKAKVDAKDPAGQAEFDAAIAGAAAMETAAEAAIVNADDKLAAGQLAVNLGGFINDFPMRQRGAKLILDSGKLEAAKVPDFQFYLGNFAYSNKDYATAAASLAAAVAGGYKGDEAAELMADAYAKAGQPGQGLAALKKAVDARRAAGQPVPANWLKRANVIAYNAKLPADSLDWALTQVELYPSNFNWLGSAQLVRRFANYGPNETIDLFRLMWRAGAYDNDPKLLGNEFKEYVEAADPRRLPGEVVRVIDKGLATGALANSRQWASDMRNLASSRIAADKASLAAAPTAASNGVNLLSNGDAWLNYGDAAKAEAFFAAALAKGGVDKDRVLTRLGIAQFDQGKYAQAKASFAQVGGARAPLARLWLALVASKAGGAAA
jgi:hypothetical protein